MIPVSISKTLVPPQNKTGLTPFVFFWFAVYMVSILQDYVSSELQSTGFYWSDTMLYNTYWIWFIPLIYFALKLFRTLTPRGSLQKMLFFVLTGIIFTTFHILLFTQVFVFISELSYDNPHRFSRILESALSNQAYITLITYTFTPIFVDYLKANNLNRSEPITVFNNVIMVRNRHRRIPIKVENIQSITTNKPYSEISANGKKYLHRDTLKKFESSLNPKLFVRVHRSTLVNKMHIVDLTSRGNGDYDAILSNGDLVRLSRHYRERWFSLTSTNT